MFNSNSRISGNNTVREAIIPELFPKTDIRSLYSGKTKIENDDLLIIIGGKNEVFFSEDLKNKIKLSIKKHILLVEIENKNVNCFFKPKELNFSNPIKQNTMSIKRTLSDSLKRELLKPTELFLTKLKQDNLNQKVFLTIRDNYLDFYHKGGRLFKFDNSGFQTHIKYASVIPKSGKDYLTEAELSIPNPKYKLASDFKTNYPRIKENCSNYSGVEAFGVSQLYHKYSYLSDSNIVVLDIEVSFQSLTDEKKQDRVNVLLYNQETQTLQFVEAKHYSNPEIRSKSKPKVIAQIKKYENQIAGKEADIKKAYSSYINILNDIFIDEALSLPMPKSIEPKVILMIFGFDADQRDGNLETIKEQLKGNNIKYYSIGDIKRIEIKNLWDQAKVL